MSSDFIKNLCESEKLIDIGNLGTAIQSSTSKWSQGNDAQRAVINNVYKDFAFHTDKELNPWWQIEFKSLIAVEYIVINNRKKNPFDEIASKLRITAYDKDDNEVLLYLGTVFFGSSPESMPLTIPLKSRVLLKKLKITLLKENYLHLSNIRFLIKDPLRNIKNNFVANRADGMGERLRALLNVMLLAEKNNGNFIFSWQTNNNDFHATNEKDLIFSKNFQKQHIMERKKIKEMQLYSLKELSSINQAQVKNCDGFLVQQGNISKMLPYPYTNFNSMDYKKAFNKVGFSEKVLLAKSHAESIPLSDKVVAIHIRAGDIIFGRYRWEPAFYSKIIPFFLLENTIQNLIKEGFSIVIFGQDDDFCSYLADKYNILYSKNLIKKYYNESQIALFDIVLMSRCQIVIAGFSGFAILALWIGGGERKSGYEYTPKLDSRLKAFNDFYGNKEGFLYSDKINPLIKSFSIIQFVHKFQESLSISDKIVYLEKCISLDDENFYYKIFLVSLYYKDNQIAKGDLYLEGQLRDNKLRSLENLAQLIQWNDTTPLTHLIEYFNSAANQGSIVAALVLLINDIHVKKDINVDFYKKIVENKENSISTILINEKIKNIS
ncbi:hypothetical protein [Psychrobacter sp. CAL346-MNA-CIBAN-0220]|uniref:hypothetical protein n=1 Tax=Psychrobacter sp. CAL346-MNA-CIBAN-0220 TaxID=3140457 RepID=UPI00331F4E62